MKRRRKPKGRWRKVEAWAGFDNGKPLFSTTHDQHDGPIGHKETSLFLSSRQAAKRFMDHRRVEICWRERGKEGK